MFWFAPAYNPAAMALSPFTVATDMWLAGAKVLLDACQRQTEAAVATARQMLDTAAGNEAVHTRSWYRKPIETPAEIWSSAAHQLTAMYSPFGRFGSPLAAMAPWTGLGRPVEMPFGQTFMPSMPTAHAGYAHPALALLMGGPAALARMVPQMFDTAPRATIEQRPQRDAKLATAGSAQKNPLAMMFAPWFDAMAALSPTRSDAATGARNGALALEAPSRPAQSANRTSADVAAQAASLDADKTAAEQLPATSQAAQRQVQDFSAYRSDGGHAVAQIIFPDQTKITLALPVSALAMAPAAVSLLPMLWPWMAATQNLQR